MVFVIYSLTRCIPMKFFHIMGIFNVGFDKLSALCNALILVLVSGHGTLETLLDAGCYSIGYLFHQRV